MGTGSWNSNKLRKARNDGEYTRHKRSQFLVEGKLQSSGFYFSPDSAKNSKERNHSTPACEFTPEIEKKNWEKNRHYRRKSF